MLSQDGLGCDPDPVLALELFRLAAEMGDAEAQVGTASLHPIGKQPATPALHVGYAQSQMAMRYSLGLHQPEAWDRNGIAQFLEVSSAAGPAVGPLHDALGRVAARATLPIPYP